MRFPIAALCIVLLAMTGCESSSGRGAVADDHQISAQLASSGVATDERLRMYTVYDKVAMDMTLSDVISKLGEGRKINVKISERYYLWQSDGAGVYVAFFEDGTFQSKTLYFKRHRDLAGITGGFDRAVTDSLKKGMTYAQVAALIGSDGAETALNRIAGYDASSYHRQVVWCNSDESYLQCVFDQDDVLQTFHSQL